MKRVIQILTCLCLLCTVTACEGLFALEPVYHASENEALIVVELDVEDTVFEILCEYGTDGTAWGGQGAAHADGSKLKRSIDLHLESSDFPENVDLSTFSIQLLVVNTKTDRKSIDLNDPLRGTIPAGELSFPIEFGTVYRVLISGSAEKGYTAQYLGVDA